MGRPGSIASARRQAVIAVESSPMTVADRKSTRLNSSHGYISYAVFFLQKKTRLNSSHGYISYAVFCLKKKKKSERNHLIHATLITYEYTLARVRRRLGTAKT